MADQKVTKAVIPAAGLGTRFLPATKATPKEMLPVVDKPAIQYVVEEAVAAGLDDILMITGRSKRALEDHFDRNYELEETLRAKGDADRLSLVQEATDLATVHYVRQGEPRGLGHAVLVAAQHVGHEAFAVLLGDDLIDARDPLLVAHGRGAGAARRQRHRADRSRAVADPAVRLRSGRGDRRRRRRPGHRSRREAEDERAEQPRDHRPVRDRAGGIRRTARHRSRGWRRDPAHRRVAGARRPL